jgi:hypothetical protein
MIQGMRTSVRDDPGLGARPPSPRARHGNLTEALSAAGELPHVGLAEALELVLLLCDRDPEKFSRAAVRWHGRYCREVDASLEEAQAVLAALGALRSRRREQSAHALADLIYRRGLERGCEGVMRWTSR